MNDLLQLIQRGVPLVSQPYAALAAELGANESDMLARLAELRSGDAPVVREIAGIFEAAALGYASALVACRVPADKLDSAGTVVAGHPGVSHCYQRQRRPARSGTLDELNLWYTLTIAPESRLGLEGTARRLAELTGASRSHVLPVTKRYKIGVRIGPQGQASSPAPMDDNGDEPAPADNAIAPQPLSADQRAAVQALQIDLPGVPEPFVPLAAKVGLSPARLLAIGADLLGRRVMRRYAAVLHHRRAGLEGNVMVAWKVSDAFADAAGKAAAAEPAVSHCYLRPAQPEWPYSLYTMIHGRTEEDCALVIDRIIAVTGLADHAAMWTGKQFKKARVRYFTDEQAQWEAAHG